MMEGRAMSKEPFVWRGLTFNWVDRQYTPDIPNLGGMRRSLRPYARVAGMTDLWEGAIAGCSRYGKSPQEALEEALKALQYAILPFAHLFNCEGVDLSEEAAEEIRMASVGF